MQISSLTLRVLLLFFPGVLGALLVDTLTVHRKRTPVEFLTHSFVLGMGAYLWLYLLRSLVDWCAGAPIFGYRPLPVTFFDVLLDEHQRIAWGEIFLAVVTSALQGLAVSAAVAHKWVPRLAQRWKISFKIGELDLWALLFNAPATRGWVTVRDLAHDMTYFGWVEAFSDTASNAQLILRTVTVYRGTTSEKLYETDRVFLERSAKSLVIEPYTIPVITSTEDSNETAAARSAVDRGDDHSGRVEPPDADAAAGLHSGSAEPLPDGDAARHEVAPELSEAPAPGLMLGDERDDSRPEREREA
jgi:hypothetical protein